ncbi:uncharacterized protein AB9W97_007637 isoform 1-T1 [Spinachia spinachia]
MTLSLIAVLQPHLLRRSSASLYHPVTYFRDNIATERMRLAALACFFAPFFLQLGGSWGIDCTASPRSLLSDQTLYRISDGHVPDCVFSWADNDTVIANQQSKDPKQVVRYDINYLITPKCMDNISFRRMCFPEGKGYRVDCKINCTFGALLKSQEQTEAAAAGVGVTANAVFVALLPLFVCLMQI